MIEKYNLTHEMLSNGMLVEGDLGKVFEFIRKLN
tara:strand:- start:270 stop:371 length:102 start_codon:yes stop_codon:yes gene_type:complete